MKTPISSVDVGSMCASAAEVTPAGLRKLETPVVDLFGAKAQYVRTFSSISSQTGTERQVRRVSGKRRSGGDVRRAPLATAFMVGALSVLSVFLLATTPPSARGDVGGDRLDRILTAVETGRRMGAAPISGAAMRSEGWVGGHMGF